MTPLRRFRLNLLGLAILVILWIGATLGAVIYAATPGNAPALLVAGLAGIAGWGFFQEALQGIGRSLDRYPLPREARR